MIRPITFLMAWHGMFAGAVTVALVTSEASDALHETAGYMVVGLLLLRAFVAALARPGSLWSWPWAPKALWRTFGRKLAQDPAAALRGRTPLAPLGGAALLAAVALGAATGLMTLPVKALEDLHEGAATLVYPVLAAHLAIVFLPALVRRLTTPATQGPEGAAGRAAGRPEPSTGSS